LVNASLELTFSQKSKTPKRFVLNSFCFKVLKILKEPFDGQLLVEILKNRQLSDDFIQVTLKINFKK
jgi:hypothetical protein